MLEVPPLIGGKVCLQTQEDQQQAAYSGPRTVLLLEEKKEMDRVKGNFKNIRKTPFLEIERKNVDMKEKMGRAMEN